MTSADFDRAVEAGIDGRATDTDLALLRSDEELWEASLWRLLNRTEDALESVEAQILEPGRTNVIEDLDREADKIDAALTALIGPPPQPEPEPEPEPKPAPPRAEDDGVEPGLAKLQLSWTEGRLVAWAAGYKAEPEAVPQLIERLHALGGGAIAWEQR